MTGMVHVRPAVPGMIMLVMSHMLGVGLMSGHCGHVVCMLFHWITYLSRVINQTPPRCT
jgi:hypothetical protein